MIAIILISFIALIGAVLTIYVLRSTPAGEKHDSALPPRQFQGLFDRRDANLLAENRQAAIESKKQRLLAHARSGDLSALDEANATHDALLYADVLGALADWASERQEDLAALVSHISKSDELRASKELAQRIIEKWKTAPDRRSTIEMMHIAALSDDPETYEQTVDAALEAWRCGRLAQFSGEELADLFISQYWLIAPRARRGGVGFRLKRRLSGVRRELATTASAG